MRLRWAQFGHNFRHQHQRRRSPRLWTLCDIRCHSRTVAPPRAILRRWPPQEPMPQPPKSRCQRVSPESGTLGSSRRHQGFSPRCGDPQARGFPSTGARQCYALLTLTELPYLGSRHHSDLQVPGASCGTLIKSQVWEPSMESRDEESRGVGTQGKEVTWAPLGRRSGT